MSFNKVIIQGNLGHDPEMRATKSQKAVANFSVATTDYRTVGDEKQEFTEWHKIIAWDKTAENCAKYLRKGSSVLVEGRLQTRSWEDKDGSKKYTTEIVANNVQFLGKPGATKNDEQQQNMGPDTPDLDSIPF